MSLAEEFNEVAAMDLKIFESSIILHLVDHVTRFSAAAVLKSKDRNETIKHLLRTWINIFGAPSKFFSDNGGEFSNEDYNEMCDSYNITIKKTVAESPFSNGLMERHNAILKEMLLKTCEESGSSLEIALQWVMNAKNLLTNVHGFSPYQLVFGMNPKLSNVLSNRPPALEGLSKSKIVASNLRNMHEARKAFINSESSEKISHALRHNLRSYKDAIFTTGDDIYYNRNDSKRWKGPDKVIGVDGQQILVKHGSFYVRCHPSHVILKDEDVRKRTLQSSHIAANYEAQEQRMNDNSTLDSDAQDRNVNNDNHTDSLQWSDDSDDNSQEHHDSE